MSTSKHIYTHILALTCVINGVNFMLSVFENMIKYKEIIFLSLLYESHIKNPVACLCPVCVP